MTVTKLALLDAVSVATAYGVGKLGEELNLPLPVTVLLSAAAGLTVLYAAGKIVFQDGVGNVVLEADAEAVEGVISGEIGLENSGLTREVEVSEYIDSISNEIDITPSECHTTVSDNPGVLCEPNSSVDILDSQGNVVTRRWYDSAGKAYRDVDMTNHGNPKTHPKSPHEHMWDWSEGSPRRK